MTEITKQPARPLLKLKTTVTNQTLLNVKNILKQEAPPIKGSLGSNKNAKVKAIEKPPAVDKKPEQLNPIQKQKITSQEDKKENSTPKTKHTIKNLKALHAKFQEEYPLIFPKYPCSPVALKVGIKEDIWQNEELVKRLDISKTQLNKFLSWYTRSKQYMATQKEGNDRYDLQGQKAGQVLPNQEAEIQAKLK